MGPRLRGGERRRLFLRRGLNRLRPHLRKIGFQFRQACFQRIDLGSVGLEFVVGGARLLDEQLLQQFDIGLQTAGATLHLLFGGAVFQAADILRGGGRGSMFGSCFARMLNYEQM